MISIVPQSARSEAMTKKEAERLLLKMAVQSAAVVEGVLVARQETTWTIGDRRRVFLVGSDSRHLSDAAEDLLSVFHSRTV